MTQTAELYDGTKLEFPDDTKPEVIARVAKEQTQKLRASELTAEDAGRAVVRGGVKAAAGGFGVAPTVAGALDQPGLGGGSTAGIDLLRSQVLPEGEKPNYRKFLDYLGFGGGEGPVREPGSSVGAEVQALQEAAASKVAPAPQSDTGKVIEAATTGAVEAIAGTGLFRVAGKLFRSYPEAAAFARDMAAAPVAQAAVGGLAAGGAEVAQQNDVNPLIGAGLGMVAGIGGATVGSGVRAGVRSGLRSGREAIDQALVRTPDALEEAARAQLRSRASDPDAALAALEGGAAREIVPGSRPTTVEATGDIGLGSLDREARTANRQAYEARAGEQNIARAAELEALKGTGTVDDALSAFDARLRNIDQATTRFEDAARQQAETATAQGVQARAADEVGQAVRDPMQSARNQAGIETKKLWNAVDPDGTLMVGTGPIKASVGKEYSTLSPTARGGISAEEKGLTELVKSYGSSLSFQELGDLRSRISKELSAIQRAVGQADPSYRRLTILKESTEDAMKKGVRRLGADDPNLFQRLASLLDEGGPGANVGEAAATAVRAGQVSGGGRGPVPRAGNQAAGGTGTAQGTPRLPISEFIARHGGLPLDAESTARDWGRTKVKGKPLAHTGGRSIDDYWRQTLMEEGYLAPDDYHGPGGRMISRDVDDEIRRLIEDDLSAGRKAGGKPAEGPERDHADARATIADRLKREGFQGKPDPAALDRAATMMTDGTETHPTTAYERAVMESPEPPAASASSTDVPLDKPAGAAPGAASTIDEGAPARYKAASRSTRELHRVYDKGSAGAVLRKGDTNNAGYKVSDASVAANAFKAGGEGANRIRQLREAGATNPALAEAAALSLSKFVRDGVLDPGRFRTWARSHEAALGALPPEVRRGFQSAADAAETLARVAERRAEVMKEAGKSAVAKVLGIEEGDLMNKLGTYVRSSKSMRELANAVKGNPEAEAGLRRMVGEWLQKEFTGNWEKFMSGEKSLNENAFANFIGDHKSALRQVFSEADVGRFQAIVDDMARAKRTLSTGKDPVGPSTAADLTAQKVKNEGLSILTNIVTGGHGWVVNLGRGVANAMKLSGTAKVDELVRQALLDPELARRLLAPAKTVKNNPQAQNALARRLMALSWPGAVQASQTQDRR